MQKVNFYKRNKLVKIVLPKSDKPMIHYFSADYIFPIHQEAIKNGIIAVDEQQRIVGLYGPEEEVIKDKEIQRFNGIITPGFVNAHCHLELSHLKSSIPKGTKLVSFLQKVMEPKIHNEDEIDNSILLADKQMHKNGIVAVGDISNTLRSREVKLNSKIHYHTFIEILGFDPNQASVSIERGEKLKKDFLPLLSSIVPHAPYSVSKDLFLKIKAYCEANELLYSMHNQESLEENKLYESKSGGFIAFYKCMNRSLDSFSAYKQSSLKTVSTWFPKDRPILLVHNTYTNQQDISFLKENNFNITWCLCPNANFYIENTLPDISLLASSGFPIVLGTDSLASNDQLCILSELKTISAHFPTLPLDKILKWATLNGAKFLGKEIELGSFEKGKKPGLNLISSVVNQSVTSDSTVTKLI